MTSQKYFKHLNLKKATELMRTPGHRLMLLHNNKGSAGMSYFVVPGGPVSAEDALEIIKRPDVLAAQDGLFKNCSQTWVLKGVSQ